MRRRQTPPRDVTGSNIGLSFIDVLASALGAAVLLFVILASSPVHPVSKARASGTFIRYEWVVDNPSALFRALIEGPGGRQFDINPYDSKGVAIFECQDGADSILAVGFSPDSKETDRPGFRTYILRLSGPAPGKWTVRLRYFGFAKPDHFPFPPVTVTTQPVAKDEQEGTTAEYLDAGTRQLKFNAILKATATVTTPRGNVCSTPPAK